MLKAVFNYLWTRKMKVFIYSIVIGIPLNLAFVNCSKPPQFKATDLTNLASNKSIDSGNLPSNVDVPVNQPDSPSQASMDRQQPPPQQPAMGEAPPSQPPPPPPAGDNNPPPVVNNPPPQQPAMGEAPPSQPPPPPPAGDNNPPPVVNNPPPQQPAMGEAPPPVAPKAKESENDDHAVSTQVEDPEKDDKDSSDDPAYLCEHISESHNEGECQHNNDGVQKSRGKHVYSSADFSGHSQIKQIKNAFGKTVLCNLEVDEVTDSGGDLILVNSHVKNLNKFHGQVRVVDEHAAGPHTEAQKKEEKFN